MADRVSVSVTKLTGRLDGCGELCGADCHRRMRRSHNRFSLAHFCPHSHYSPTQDVNGAKPDLAAIGLNVAGC
jgi:hypothetical protein